jgi:outer membrane protein OmpA-like peptidoglycan-associated protein/tetratricopeptide (TPR) repeat protein
MKITYTIIFALLVCFNGYSQSAASRRALKAYNDMAYAEAADLYQEVVDKTGGTQEELQNLADSYLKLQEYIDAELTYEKLFKLFPQQKFPVVLKYAQVLAHNERYEESLKYYSTYQYDARGKNFSEAYKNLNKFFRDSADVTVNILPLNTLQSEFSPVVYEKGIVFVSNRTTGGGIKKVYGRNQTPYFDLYYLKDTSVLKKKGFTDAIVAQNANLGIKRFNSDYTPETSNDNRTIGHFDPVYLNDDETGESLETEMFDKLVNSKYHEGPFTFSKNYDTIFFTRNSYFQGRSSKDANDVTRLQIFYATKGPGGKYEHIQQFPFNSPDYSVAHPVLSPDGKRLYFVSDKKGGLGETDIYYCEIREHRFTEPVNAGNVINSAGSEMFPYVNGDGSIFFSSTGHAGLGGLDIFRADFQNNHFLTPRNLGYPINSSKDDFGISSTDARGTRGYFSSNRLRGRADDNIYSFADNRPLGILVQGIIKVKHYDEDGKEIIEPLENATVTLSPLGYKVKTDRSGTFEFVVSRGKMYTIEVEKDKLGKKQKDINLVNIAPKKDTYEVELLLETESPAVPTIGKVLEADSRAPVKNAFVYLYEVESGNAMKLKTDSSGSFSAPVRPDKTYIVKSNADGYFSDCYKFHSGKTLTGNLNLENLQLKKIEVNTTFEVKNLLYDYNKSDIRPDAAEVLNKVVKFLKDYPEIEVELGAHSDSRGKDDYNLNLSAARAKSAVDYIVSQGIDSSRITSKGYGESALLNKCSNNVKCSEEEHQVNRRTEVKVTGVKNNEGENKENPDVDPVSLFKNLGDFSDCKQFKVGQ